MRITMRAICIALFVFTCSATPIRAVTIDLDFSSLPSAQSPAGPDWTYLSTNGLTESQVFSVGLNGSNDPTLFQNSINAPDTGSDGNRYDLLNALDPTKQAFTLDVRAAVLNEQFVSNNFGFSFYVIYGGSLIGVGVGTSDIQVADDTGLRTVLTGVNNTGYHDYQIVGTVGVGGTWQLFRDATLIGQGNFAAAAGNFLLLGDGSAGGNAQAEVTNFQFTQTSAAVPEPSTLLLLGTGLIGLIGYGRRRKRDA